eukprot:GHVU01234999.1.p1 GENE.GHVU01234999.1~~GHVU01234999.1.p1  ORF type:complete len:155 (-),score=19.85 GHVU01234999.1:11-475(-)
MNADGDSNAYVNRKTRIVMIHSVVINICEDLCHHLWRECSPKSLSKMSFLNEQKSTAAGFCSRLATTLVVESLVVEGNQRRSNQRWTAAAAAAAATLVLSSSLALLVVCGPLESSVRQVVAGLRYTGGGGGSSRGGGCSGASRCHRRVVAWATS